LVRVLLGAAAAAAIATAIALALAMTYRRVTTPDHQIDWDQIRRQ
jgi:hypothetical protein